jgi:hypothetical protein
MCSVFGIASGWWSVLGLIANLIGVLFLLFDLIRMQRMWRAKAAAVLSSVNAMAEDRGGLKPEIIQEIARRLPAGEYNDLTQSQQKAEEDRVTAQTSLLWSFIGLGFILIGFVGQLIGSWPCPYAHPSG